MEETRQAGPSREFLITLFLIVTITVLVGAYAYYRSEADRIRQEKYQELASIAQLKASQVREWQVDCLTDIEALARSPFFKTVLEQWLQDHKDLQIERVLREGLQVERRGGVYSDVLIVNPEGSILICANTDPEPLDPVEQKAVQDSLSAASPLLGKLYRTSQGSVNLDAVASITGSSGRPIAAVVYRISADSLLYPLINSWPTPSKTAETLLVRKDGSDVLFLNNVRHQPDAALNVRIPLTRTDVSAVQVVLGKVGMLQGRDYRGVDVLADLRQIPGTQLFMVTKVDTDEILYESHYRGLVVVLFVVVFVLLAGVAVAYVYRRRQATLYRDLYRLKQEQEDAIRSQEAWLRLAQEAANAGTWEWVLATNENIWSDELWGLYGLEPHGCKPSYTSWLNTVHPDDRATVEQAVNQAASKGLELKAEWRTNEREGSERWLMSRGKPVLGTNGLPARYIGIVIDITDRKNVEKALRETTENLSEAQRVAQIGNWTFDSQTNGVTWSDEVYRIIGIDKSDFDGSYESFLRYVHPDDQQLAVDTNLLARTQGSPLDLDYRIVTPDGQMKTVREIGYAKRDHAGAVVGLFGTIQDVTDRKRAEEALSASEEKYRQLFAKAKDAIVITDAESMSFLDVNPAAEALWGYTKSELMTMTPVDLSLEPEQTKEALKRGTRPEGTHVPMRRQRKKDGASITVEISSSFPFTWKDRKVVCSAVRDITDRIRAEQAVAESEARYRQISEVTFEAILFHDHGILLEANDQYFEMLGYRRDELIGTPALEKTISPDSLETVKRNIASGLTKTYEAMAMRKDGTTFPIEIRARNAEFRGKTVRAVAARDVSEQKRLGEKLRQAQKMEAIGTLAGGVAHDFNNLLQIVLGYSEFLLSTKHERDPEHGGLEKIHSAAQRGADLVHNLLMFSRRVSPALHPMVLNEEIVEVQKLLSRTIPKTIKVHLKLSGDLAPVQADMSQMGQVLMNLGVNARDAMPEGGALTIETTNVELDENYCAAHPEVRPGSYVLLCVSDTGHGMDKDTLPHIFEPFFTTKAIGKGTGLGLSSVYGIIKQHNGYIYCYSEPGHGTAFKIYLPAVHQETESVSERAESPIRGGTETILLVDDEEMLRDLGRDILSQWGYQVLTAADGREALEMYQKEGERISLVILDLIMPEMDGKRCLAELLKIDPGVKVFIASGYSQNGPLPRAELIGAMNFVEKPYNMKQLLRMVREILDKA